MCVFLRVLFNFLPAFLTWNIPTDLSYSLVSNDYIFLLCTETLAETHRGLRPFVQALFEWTVWNLFSSSMIVGLFKYVARISLSLILLYPASPGLRQSWTIFLKRKYSRPDQDSNSSLQLYGLALYQLSHPDELAGQARKFSLIPFLLYTFSDRLSVFENQHLHGITFFNLGVFNVGTNRGKFNMKICFPDWTSVGHKC